MQSKALRIGCMSLAFAIAVAVTSFFIFSAFMSNEAEANLIAFTAATRAICGFVDREGRWPNSIDELRKEQMPLDEKAILDRVQIAFAVPLSDIAKCTPENFPYVVGSKPIYPSSAREKVRQLIACVKIAQNNFESSSQTREKLIEKRE